MHNQSEWEQQVNLESTRCPDTAPASESRLSKGAIAGISVASCLFGFSAIGLLVFLYFKRRPKVQPVLVETTFSETGSLTGLVRPFTSFRACFQYVARLNWLSNQV